MQWRDPTVERWLRAETRGDEVVVSLPTGDAANFAVRSLSAFDWRCLLDEWKPGVMVYAVHPTALPQLANLLEPLGFPVDRLRDLGRSPDLPLGEDLIRAVAERWPFLDDHQRIGVAWLVTRDRALLADAPGLGKTLQAMCACLWRHPSGRFLVISPALAKYNWRSEIGRFDPSATVEVVDPGKPYAGQSRWTVVNYDILQRHDERFRADGFTGVVVDEAHYIRRQSRRFRYVERLAGKNKAVPARRPDSLYQLTGTEMIRPADLYNLLYLMDHRLANNRAAYLREFCKEKETEIDFSELPRLVEMTKDSILKRFKEDVFDMPDKKRYWVGAAGDTEEYEALEASVAEALRENGIGYVDRHNLFQAMTVARGDLMRLRQAVAVQKTSTSIRYAEDAVRQGRKFIVFTNFDEPRRKIVSHFGGQVVTIFGGVPAKKRKDLVDRFQTDPDCVGMVCNLVAGGISVNAQAATVVIHNDLDWNPANHHQGDDRAHRRGQTKEVTCFYLTADGTVEDRVKAVYDYKLAGMEMSDEARRKHGLDLERRLGGAPGRPPRVSPRAVQAAFLNGILERHGGKAA